MDYGIDCGIIDSKEGGSLLPSEVSLSSWKRQSYSKFEEGMLRKVK